MFAIRTAGGIFRVPALRLVDVLRQHCAREHVWPA
jgi:hypothetical protein